MRDCRRSESAVAGRLAYHDVERVDSTVEKLIERAVVNVVSHTVAETGVDVLGFFGNAGHQVV